MIVDIVYDDYDELHEFVDKIQKFKKLNLDENLLRRFFARCITHGFAKKVIHNDKVYGVMFGLVSKNNWGKLIAFDTLTYCIRETDKMIKLFEKWAKSSGAEEMHIANAYGSKRYDKLLDTLGYDSYKTYRKEF